MSKIIKIHEPSSSKLEQLMTAIEGTCSIDEREKARKIFKLYLDGRAEINEK